MKPSRQLRVLGWLGVIVASLAAVPAAGVLLVLRESPLKTVGVHGMLPENFHQLLFTVAAQCVLIDAGLVAVLGLLCTRRGWLGRVSAMVAGAIGLLGYAAGPMLWGSANSILFVCVGLLGFLPLVLAGAYVAALGATSAVEERLAARWSAAKVSVVPLALACALFAVSSLLKALLLPFTVEGVVTQETEESDACSDADTLERRCGGVSALATSPNAVVLASGHDNQRFLRAFDLQPPWRRRWQVELEVERAAEYDSSAQLVASPDGKYLALMAGKSVLLIDGANGKVLRPIEGCDAPDKHGRRHLLLAFSPDSSQLLVAQRSLCVQSLTGGGASDRIELEGGDRQQVTFASYAPSAQQVWLLRSGHPQCWSLVERKRALELADTVEHLAVSPDGARVATIGRDGLRLWDAHTGARLAEVDTNALARTGNPPQGPLVFLPDSRHVVALASYGYYVMDPATGDVSRQQDRRRPYRRLAVQGQSLVLGMDAYSGSSDPTVSFKAADTLIRSIKQ